MTRTPHRCPFSLPRLPSTPPPLPRFLAKVRGKTGSKLYGPQAGADYIDNHK